MASSSEAVMKSQRKKKMFAVEQFGGKCQICGYNKCINALEFHHIDPATKEFSPSYVIFSRKWEEAFKELEKCILICANCHRENHFSERMINEEYTVLPTIQLNCASCLGEFSTKNPVQRYCGSQCQHIAQRKVTTIPTKEEIENLRMKKLTWKEVGNHYGISDNSIRKWAKRFQILK